MNLVVIKVGSGVLVNDDFTLNRDRIVNLVDQLIAIRKQDVSVLLVSSGAVASGKSLATLDVSDASIARHAYAAIGQAKLINIYADAFAQADINVSQVLLLRDNFSNRHECVPLTETLQILLKNGVVPIINENDPVTKKQFSDNDELAMLLAVTLKAKALYLVTNVDGLYEEDPSKNPDAEVIKVVEQFTPDLFQKAGASSSHGSGGMYGKLKSAKHAMEAGIDTWIINGTRDNSLTDCAIDGVCGTYFKAQQTNDSQMQKWLKTGALATGQIVVDSGAVKALQNRKSLLAVGVRKVLGTFTQKDVVDILDQDGNEVAVAVTQIDNEALLNALESGETADTIVAHADYISLVT